MIGFFNRCRMKLVTLSIIACCVIVSCSQNSTPSSPMKKTVGLFLAKANNDLISHCKCEHTFISAPSQMDCPWCGCGWLFVCPKCHRAFTFARAEKCDLTWEELAHKDLDGKFGKQPSQEDIDEWIAFMKIFTKDIELGKQYVYIDSFAIAVDAAHVRFEGLHARHDLNGIPQTKALLDPKIMDRTLGSRVYWDQRRVDQK